jgi:hypothetical protein
MRVSDHPWVRAYFGGRRGQNGRLNLTERI